MRYPCLVKKRQCKTPVKVSLEQEELSVYGEPVAAKEIETTCNYQDSAKTVLTAEKKLIQLSGVAFFPGDIAPDLPNLSGGTIGGERGEEENISGKKSQKPGRNSKLQ